MADPIDSALQASLSSHAALNMTLHDSFKINLKISMLRTRRGESKDKSSYLVRDGYWHMKWIILSLSLRTISTKPLQKLLADERILCALDTDHLRP